MSDEFDHLRLLEAILFASAEPLGSAQLGRFLPEGADLAALMEELSGLYANRGVILTKIGDKWAFRTAADLAGRLQIEKQVERKLSKPAVDTLAIIAYHQPITRGEIEEIRGVSLSKGTLDTLLEVGWIRPRGRRRTPGRPVTWGTSEAFLDHFGLDSLDALPGQAELKAAGLLDKRPAATVLRVRGLLLKDEEQEGQEEAEDRLEESQDADDLPLEPWDLLAAEFGEDEEAEPTASKH
ncbi:MAG: SMC-Scp complex subunit ScpB [Pseudomonadota bacterium]